MTTPKGIVFNSLSLHQQRIIRDFTWKRIEHELACLGDGAARTPWTVVYAAVWPDVYKRTEIDPKYVRNAILNHYRNYLAYADGSGMGASHSFVKCGAEIVASDQNLTEKMVGASQGLHSTNQPPSSWRSIASIVDVSLGDDFTPCAALLPNEPKNERDFLSMAIAAHIGVLHVLMRGSAPYGMDRMEDNACFSGAVLFPQTRINGPGEKAFKGPSALVGHPSWIAIEKRITVHLRTMWWQVQGEEDRKNFTGLLQEKFRLSQQGAWRVSQALIRAAYAADYRAVKELVGACTKMALRTPVMGLDTMEQNLLLRVQNIWSNLCTKEI